jgi:hypothetical protein
MTDNHNDSENKIDVRQTFEDIESGQLEKLSDTDEFSDDFDPSEINLSQKLNYQKPSAVPTAVSKPSIPVNTAQISKKQVNGISYKKMKKVGLEFNNGEPAPVAFKNMALQLLFIVVVVVAVIAVLAAKNFIIDKTTDDSVFTLTMSSKYGETAAIDGINDYVADKSYGYAAASAISKIGGSSVTEASLLAQNGNKDNSYYTAGMTKILEAAFPDADITSRENLSNYTLLTEIHDNLSAGNAVIVSMALSEDRYLPDDDAMTYAVISSANYSTDEISVVTPFGRTDTMSAEELIAATRYSDFAASSVRTKLEFILGLKSKNTVFFIQKKS